MKWLIVERSEVIGWHESRKATTLPADEGARTHVDATGNSLIPDYMNCRDQMKNAGRQGERPHWNGSAVVVPADKRPAMVLSTDTQPDSKEASVMMDKAPTDSVMLTVTCTSNPGLTGTQYLHADTDKGPRRIKVDFQNGIATRDLNLQEPGEYYFRSNADYRVADPLKIIIYE